MLWLLVGACVQGGGREAGGDSARCGDVEPAVVEPATLHVHPAYQCGSGLAYPDNEALMAVTGGPARLTLIEQEPEDAVSGIVLEPGFLPNDGLTAELTDDGDKASIRLDATLICDEMIAGPSDVTFDLVVDRDGCTASQDVPVTVIVVE